MELKDPGYNGIIGVGYMRNFYPHIIVLIVVALLAVPGVAAESNATNTTMAVTENVTTTTTELAVTTGVVSETTTVVANTTVTTIPLTTSTQNMTATASAPVTTVVPTSASETLDTTGEITAASSPLGAALLIDGVYYGTTPVTLSNIPVGNHIVRLTLSGYYDYEGSIYVTPDKVTNVYGTLQPSGSSVTVQTPTTTSVAITTATVQPTQTTSGGLFDSPTVIAALIGIITACIGAGATIFTHMKKP